MRWSIIRLIWLRELRDQLRDRRTLFMIAVLPLLLYPVLGFAVLQFAAGFVQKQSVIGIVCGPGGPDNFPARPLPEARNLISCAHWVLAPTQRGQGWVAAAAVFQASIPYPRLVENGQFTPLLPSVRGDGVDPKHPSKVARLVTQVQVKIVFLDDDNPAPLHEGKVDLILKASPDFFAALEGDERQEAGPRPRIFIATRPNDDFSRQARSRLYGLLDGWEHNLKTVRLARRGLTRAFDQPFDPVDPELGKAAGAATGLFDLFVRIFPFMLVLWSLAGALYPAVDLCAGEKERGTMETLLISPAGREEIVLGKFLTIWVFSAGTSFLNLVSMGLTTWNFRDQIPTPLTVGAMFWCVVLVLPLSAFFSAISLALGAYARSTKEGQYYLMPLFLVTMPLIFLTLAPGVRLNSVYSLVPITGVALLMQRLMTAASLAQVPWLFFVPVLAPIVLYSWLALRWAMAQFHREEVLFREAERWDLRLWLGRLFRDKEATPTIGQAMFLFGLIVFLRWLSLSLGIDRPLVHTGISLLAFVAMPTLAMALLLNTRPSGALGIRLPLGREMGLAAGLALLLLPPLAGLAQLVFVQFPRLGEMLAEGQPMVRELRELREVAAPLVIFGLLPAVCEELAFRGFILTGLLRGLRPRDAVLLSSFLFAVFHMNVFQFLPSFFLGVVLGLLTVRSKSVFPAMIFHFLHNSLLIGGMYLVNATDLPDLAALFWAGGIGLGVLGGTWLLWRLYRKPYVELAEKLVGEARQGKD